MKSLEALENWYNTESPNTKAYEYEHHYRLIKNDLEQYEKLKQTIKQKKEDAEIKLKITFREMKKDTTNHNFYLY